MDKLTISACRECQLCQQKYFWRYERAIFPVQEVETDALSIGSAVHAGMDAADVEEGLLKVDDCFRDSSAVSSEQWFKQDELRAKCRAMVRRSWERWPSRPKLQEHVFEVPVRNPETSGTSRSFIFSGKIDGVNSDTVFDYKTVSDPVKFITMKRLSYQLPAYRYGSQEPIQQLIYRLITKPTLRRGGITKTRKEPESPEDYEARCYEWLGQDGKLTKEDILFTEASMAGFLHYLWQMSQAILFARRSQIWLRNELACNTWKRTCEYLPLCLQLADGTALDEVRTDGFQSGDPHPELNGDEE